MRRCGHSEPSDPIVCCEGISREQREQQDRNGVGNLPASQIGRHADGEQNAGAPFQQPEIDVLHAPRLTLPRTRWRDRGATPSRAGAAWTGVPPHPGPARSRTHRWSGGT